MTWQRGHLEVQDLLRQGALEPVSGAAADGTALLTSAARLVASEAVQALERARAIFEAACELLPRQTLFRP